MTSSTKSLAHRHHQPSVSVVMHYQNREIVEKSVGGRSSSNPRTLEDRLQSVPLGTISEPTARNPQRSDSGRKATITYGSAKPSWSPVSPNERQALQDRAPRLPRMIATRQRQIASFANPSTDYGLIKSYRARSPPPAPRIQRLPTPELSDMECDYFCTCCKRKGEKIHVVKSKSTRRADAEGEMRKWYDLASGAAAAHAHVCQRDQMINTRRFESEDIDNT